MKQALLIFAVLAFSFNANAQNDSSEQNSEHQQPAYQQQNNPPPQYQPAPGRWAQPSYRTKYNYLKGSIGFASIDDYSDGSGSINYDSSAVMPINLAYGVASGHISFEAELGFSAFDYTFVPVFGSSDPSFDGDLAASKLMFNGMFKTSQTGSNFYVGAGFGFVSVAIDGLSDELVGSSFATQFILGGEMRSSERSSVFIEYKQLASSGLELDNSFASIDFDFEEASLNVGVKLYF